MRFFVCMRTVNVDWTGCITLFTEVGKLVWAPISVPFSIPPAMRYRMNRKTIR